VQLFDSIGEAQVESGYFDALLSGSRHTASLVCSETGELVDSDGTSRNIGGEIDKLWLRALRSKCDVVLTSGKTFRAEQYKMPRRADLAVLSHSPVDQSSLKIAHTQKVVEFEESGYEEAAKELINKGYKNIQIEFGPRGISELLGSNFEFDLWLSGLSDESVLSGAKRLSVGAEIVARVGSLSIALAR
jgi:hypothetical protein